SKDEVLRAVMTTSLAELDVAIASEPTAERLSDRGWFQARLGRWSAAAADFGEAVQRRPEVLPFRSWQALALLAAGDYDGLRRARSDLLNRFGTSTDPQTARSVARACVLAPDEAADREAPVRLAELAVNGAPDAGKPTALNTLGVALYRAGRF